jgi:hypothetical protein
MLDPTPAVRSRKVRQALKLAARAQKLQTRYDQTLACAAPLRARAEVLRQAAQAIELTLTGGQLAELRRARSEAPQPRCR